jgi:hypothetical protein
MPKPPSPVLVALEQFRADLLRRERQVAVRLVRTYGDIYRTLQSSIAALDAEIALMDSPTPNQVQKLRRFKALKTQVEREITQYGAWADKEIGMAARQSLVDGMVHAEQLTLAGVPQQLQAAIAGVWNTLPTDAVETLMGFLSPGSPLHTSLVDQMGPATADLFEQQLLEGIALGYNPRKIASIARRTLGQPLNWTLRTSRTAQLWAYRESTRASYVANSDIVTGWIWHAELGPRTCASCIAQHGTFHPNTETLNDHHNGRCAMVPQTVSWRALGIPIDDAPPVAVPGDGQRWFDAQPEAVQRQIMGGATHRAYKDGAVSWDKLTVEHDDTVYGKMKVQPSLVEMLGDDAKQYYRR